MKILKIFIQCVCIFINKLKALLKNIISKLQLNSHFAKYEYSEKLNNITTFQRNNLAEVEL